MEFNLENHKRIDRQLITVLKLLCNVIFDRSVKNEMLKLKDVLPQVRIVKLN